MEVRSPQDLGAAAHGRRRTLRLSQTKVAESAGVSRAWLTQFESGKPTVEIGRVLSVLGALGFILDLRAPDETPTEMRPARPGELQDLDSLIEGYVKGVDP
jgi:HTH-type transcriptional regulator/antitoxin HipB